MSFVIALLAMIIALVACAALDRSQGSRPGTDDTVSFRFGSSAAFRRP
jgi:hypothetical protein